MSFKWHKRNHDDALDGMMSLTLEERGAYNTILDLMYQRRGSIPDDARWIAGWLGCSLRKWAVIRASLIVKGKLFEVSINGAPSLANERVERECAADKAKAEKPQVVRFAADSAPGQARAKAEKAPAANENNGLEALDIDKERDKNRKATPSCPAAPNAAPKVDWFERAWRLYPALGCQRSKSKKLTAPIWRKAAKEAGGEERLHDAVARYVREDKQHKGECGPPGFHRWLNDGKWSHWLPEARAPAAGSSSAGIDPRILALHEKLQSGAYANA